MQLKEINRISNPETGKTYRIMTIMMRDVEQFVVQTEYDYGWQSLGHENTESDALETIRLIMLHHEEMKALSRTATHPRNESSPWGAVQVKTIYADGVVSVSTSSHGGFLLTPEANLKIPAPLRNTGGIYEEDCEWSKVAFAFPELFTTWEKRGARRTLLNQDPDAYTEVTGITVPLEDSVTLRERRFHAINRNNWVVISAIRHSDTAILVTAVLGGRSSLGRDLQEDKSFLVPSSEYDMRPEFGFVIDPKRHHEMPSKESASLEPQF